MTSQPLCANLIERYLCSRGRRYFRGRHDGEFFYVANTHPRRLHVHLEISPAHRDVFTIRVTPTCFFPATDRARLTRFAEMWNQRNREVIALVHGSSDPQRTGIAAHRSEWIGDRVGFEDFASFVDRTIAAALDLFDELTPVAELPSTTQPLLQDAG
ncbi:MAG TPA: hypothetical protein VLZ05_25145 [Mycobacterium sp.]|nr:hypothetical protein [Mycobacterium sp.]HUH71871.1 hypothetical protein [Mycobacterium sp.]